MKTEASVAITPRIVVCHPTRIITLDGQRMFVKLMLPTAIPKPSPNQRSVNTMAGTISPAAAPTSSTLFRVKMYLQVAEWRAGPTFRGCPTLVVRASEGQGGSRISSARMPKPKRYQHQPGAPPLPSQYQWVPHPSLFSGEGWETTTLTRPPARTFPAQKFLPPTLQIISPRKRTMELRHSNRSLRKRPAHHCAFRDGDWSHARCRRTNKVGAFSPVKLWSRA
jgi:hypothetical protein